MSFERKTFEKIYDLNIEIKNTLLFNENEDDFFQVMFIINLKSNDETKPFLSDIEAIGIFKLDKLNLNDSEIKSYHNSASVIVYPYIRAFLSNLSVISGINPITLPTVNFIN